ncbi:MAG: phosphodiester glycosidase family protein [Chitinophagales bacterium]|nr:phosphodiester glycosidase family protein [Chitinophagales bacterium]
MKRFLFLQIFLFVGLVTSFAQLNWQNVDSLYQPLPPSVHIFRTTDQLDGKPNNAYYLVADLRDKKLDFTVDTTYKRRLSPSQFYTKNNNPLLVVNTTFFSFATDQNLNVVIRDGKLVSYNIHTIPGKGKDTLTYRHPFGSAIGISRKRKADVAWLYTDSIISVPKASRWVIPPVKDSIERPGWLYLSYKTSIPQHMGFEKWKMQTAVGGGPVLLQEGKIRITNNEELKFAGKAINDKHPRTAMGYTKDNKLIILVIEGRNPGIAEGATLTQEAQILKDLGCREALNLDGGGSSCMLVNGKETIKPSDKEGQRSVPAVFLIKQKN